MCWIKAVKVVGCLSSGMVTVVQLDIWLLLMGKLVVGISVNLEVLRGWSYVQRSVC